MGANESLVNSRLNPLGFHRSRMGFHEIPWASMGVHGSLGVSRGILLALTGGHVFSMGLP